MKGRKLGLNIKDLQQQEEINIQPEQNEETRIHKNEERLRNLWDNYKVPTPVSQGCQKEKNKSKKLKTYLNK